eukprot:249080-Prorocentrum_minimum.AAC.1
MGVGVDRMRVGIDRIGVVVDRMGLGVDRTGAGVDRTGSLRRSPRNVDRHANVARVGLDAGTVESMAVGGLNAGSSFVRKASTGKSSPLESDKAAQQGRLYNSVCSRRSSNVTRAAKRRHRGDGEASGEERTLDRLPARVASLRPRPRALASGASRFHSASSPPPDGSPEGVRRGSIGGPEGVRRESVGGPGRRRAARRSRWPSRGAAGGYPRTGRAFVRARRALRGIAARRSPRGRGGSSGQPGAAGPPSAPPALGTVSHPTRCQRGSEG